MRYLLYDLLIRRHSSTSLYLFQHMKRVQEYHLVQDVTWIFELCHLVLKASLKAEGLI